MVKRHWVCPRSSSCPADSCTPPNHDFIPTVPLYLPGAEPWFIHPAVAADASSSTSTAAQCQKPFSVPRDSSDWYFCFMHTTPCGRGRPAPLVPAAGSATTRTLRSGAPGGQILGFKNTFAFKMPGGGKRVYTNWEGFKRFLMRDGGEDGQDCSDYQVEGTTDLGRDISNMGIHTPALPQYWGLATGAAISIAPPHYPGDLAGGNVLQGPSGIHSNLPSPSMDNPGMHVGAAGRPIACNAASQLQGRQRWGAATSVVGGAGQDHVDHP